jgi:hypothetical protein
LASELEVSREGPRGFIDRRASARFDFVRRFLEREEDRAEQNNQRYMPAVDPVRAMTNLVELTGKCPSLGAAAYLGGLPRLVMRRRV